MTGRLAARGSAVGDAQTSVLIGAYWKAPLGYKCHVFSNLLTVGCPESKSVKLFTGKAWRAASP